MINLVSVIVDSRENFTKPKITEKCTLRIVGPDYSDKIYRSCLNIAGIVELASDPNVEKIVMADTTIWYASFPEVEDNLADFGAKIEISEKFLDNLWTNTKTYVYGTEIYGRYFAKFFAAVMTGGKEEYKKIFSEWLLRNTRGIKKQTYGLPALHPWLCENGFVTASNYEDILAATNGCDRAFLIDWAQKHKIPEKLGKLKESRRNRPMTIEEARKSWKLCEKGPHTYAIEWKLSTSKAKEVIIPDVIGNRKVIECTINTWKDEGVYDRVIVPAGVRLYATSMRTAQFQNYSNVLYRQDYIQAGEPSTYEIPEDKTELEVGVFADFKSLEHIKGLDHIERISRAAFRGSGLKGPFDIPESVKVISEFAFADTKIREIRIHDTVQMIGSGAFCGIEKIFCSPTVASKLANPTHC